MEEPVTRWMRHVSRLHPSLLSSPHLAAFVLHSSSLPPLSCGVLIPLKSFSQFHHRSLPSSLCLVCRCISLRPLSVSSAGVSPLTAVHSSSLSVGLPRSDTCALFSRTCTLTLFLSASLLMRVANSVCPPPSLSLLPPLLAPPSLQCLCRQLHVCSHRQCFSNVSLYAHLHILNIATKSPRILSACRWRLRQTAPEVPPLVGHRAQDGLSCVTGFASLKPAWDVFKGLSIFNRFEPHSQPTLIEIRLRLRVQNDSKFDFRH